MSRLAFPVIAAALALVAAACDSRPAPSRPQTGGYGVEPESPAPATTEAPPMRSDKIVKSNEQWRKVLTPEQYEVTREHGTERAFSGEYWDTKDQGVYHCVACDLPLYSSQTKFDSGTGWPSFWEPVAPDAVGTRNDRSLFMVRTEVHCARCEAHLGHVFDDGPEPTGLRHCINSVSLKFHPATSTAKE